MTVLVAWINHLGVRVAKVRTVEAANPEVRYLRYFYIPKIARFSYAATMLMSLPLEALRIRKFAPHCLLISWAYPDGVAGILLAKMLRIPAIIKVHGSDINMNLQHQMRARQILWALNRADAIMAVSGALAEKLVELGVSREKIQVIYNGIDRKLFSPSDLRNSRHKLGLSPNRKLVLFIGNLTQEKGCIDLFESFKIICEQTLDVDLAYIGSGIESDSLGLRISQCGLEDRVQLLGSMNHIALAGWIGASTLVALPSHNEGVPNVLLEAMACGKPVVATKVGGIPEVVKPQAGILVELNDQRALTAALGIALETNWDPQKIVDSVESFSWDHNSKKVNELISFVVNESQV